MTKRTDKERRRFLPPRTWREVKAALEATGVKDSDVIYALDLGPSRGKILIDRDKDKTSLEITDDAEQLMEP